MAYRPFNTTQRQQLRHGRRRAGAIVASRTAPSRRNRLVRGQSSRPANAGGRQLDLGDVDGLGALGPLLRLVVDLRSLGERAIAVSGNASEMDEQIPAAIIRCDEAEPLVVAEPLHGTRCHQIPSVLLLSNSWKARRRHQTRETYQGSRQEG